MAILRVVARIAVIGLGEAGAAIARDLRAAGAAVVGFDPAVTDGGIDRAPTAAAAAGGADVVLSVNAASVAADVAGSVAGVLGPGAVFADLNTASPGAKRAVAAIVEPSGARFADVALMAPVAGRGLRTPALASGPGAARFAEVVGGLGMPVTAIGPETGAAAARKLVRSVFMKGLAAAIGEALEAADRIGGRDALYADIAATLTAADEALLQRLVEPAVRSTPPAVPTRWRPRARCSRSSASSRGSPRRRRHGCARCAPRTGSFARMSSPELSPTDFYLLDEKLTDEERAIRDRAARVLRARGHADHQRLLGAGRVPVRARPEDRRARAGGRDHRRATAARG